MSFVHARQANVIQFSTPNTIFQLLPFFALSREKKNFIFENVQRLIRSQSSTRSVFDALFLDALLS